MVNALSQVQAELGREINPVIMPKDKFIAMFEKQDRFTKRVLQEPKLFVIGDEDEFEKLDA